MEKLGDDELGCILTKVVDRRDRLSCSEVCRQWKIAEGLTRTSLRVLETESLCSFLPRFPNLATIELGGKVSDLQLGFIARTCPCLRTLDLNARRSRGMLEGEEPVGWDSGDVGDEGLRVLSTGCRHLRKVSLRRRKGVGASGVGSLIKSASSLKSLDLCWCSRIDDHALKIISTAGSLQELNLRGCTSITNEGLAFLGSGSASRTLRRLDISLCDQVSDFGVSQLQHMELDVLNLSECGPGITDTAGACIAEIRSLRKLDISWLINLTDHTLNAVSQNCMNLEELNVTGCELVTETGILSFAGHRKMAFLVMASCYGVHPHYVATMVLRSESIRHVGFDRSMRSWIALPLQEKLNNLCRVDWL